MSSRQIMRYASVPALSASLLTVVLRVSLARFFRIEAAIMGGLMLTACSVYESHCGMLPHRPECIFSLSDLQTCEAQNQHWRKLVGSTTRYECRRESDCGWREKLCTRTKEVCKEYTVPVYDDRSYKRLVATCMSERRH